MPRSNNKILKIFKAWILFLILESYVITIYSIKTEETKITFDPGDETQVNPESTIGTFDLEGSAQPIITTTVKDLSDYETQQKDDDSLVSTPSSPSSSIMAETSSESQDVSPSSSKTNTITSKKSASSRSKTLTGSKTGSSESIERTHSPSKSKNTRSRSHRRSKSLYEKSIKSGKKMSGSSKRSRKYISESSPSLSYSESTLSKSAGIISPELSVKKMEYSKDLLGDSLTPAKTQEYFGSSSTDPSRSYPKSSLVPEDTSAKIPEYSYMEPSSLLLDESSVKTQMPSRKSSPRSEVSMKPYSPVHEESEQSSLLDGSSLSERSVDVSSLPLKSSLQAEIGSNSMVLLSPLYGISALSGVQPDSDEDALKIEIAITESLFNTGIHISNADIVIFTNRIISNMVDPNLNDFSALIDPNSFESIPSYQRHSFNYIECVYQLENILFHTRSLIENITMTHILVACNNIRNSLEINNSILEKGEVLNKAIKYLILRIYNISNDDIIKIINGIYPLPEILDPVNIERLCNSLLDDFKSNKFSFPLVIEFWKSLLIQQLHIFNYNSKELIDQFVNDKFGLINILFETMFISPIKMCPYIVSTMFFNINQFNVDEIKINSIKIHTFCLIYLKNMGFNEQIILEVLEKPEIKIDSTMNSLTKNLSPGFNILPYFHPEFPKIGDEFEWETCYSIFSSVSLVLNSINEKLLFPQLVPLCNKLTKKEPVLSYVLDLFERILGIPKNITSHLAEKRNINELITSLSTNLEVSTEFIDDFYNKYIYGNPMKYLYKLHTVFTKTIEYVSKIEAGKSLNGFSYVTNNKGESNNLLERITKWSSIHLYFISFTFSIPNPIEVLGGIYSFTPDKCESLLFPFFRRITFSNRSSIIDSYTICMSIYSVIYKNNISPVLVKNNDPETIKSVLNYKIGAWAPTKNEWMRSIYMSLESKLDVVPSISTVQTLGITINLDYFNCFSSINKYLHGLILSSRKKNALRIEQEKEILGNRLLGFEICSAMSIGAHSTKEEAIELRLISTVLESVRQFGFNINIEIIKEYVQHQKQVSNSRFPSVMNILEHVSSKYPKKLRDLMFKALNENGSNSNSSPYFVKAEVIIESTLRKYQCEIRKGETNFSERSFEISDGDLSTKTKGKDGLYNHILNSCLSWRTYGYYNIISCYSGILSSNICSSKDITLDVVIDVATLLEWPEGLILVTLSQDFSFSDLNSFLELRAKLDQAEIDEYNKVASDLIVYVSEQKNDFSWSEKSLTNPEVTVSEKNEPIVDERESLFSGINYSFAFGFLKGESNDIIQLWNYRRDIVLKQIKYFPIDRSLKLSNEFIRNSMLTTPFNDLEVPNIENLPMLISIFKELCYEEPYGALLCEINAKNNGIPDVKLLSYYSDEISGSISVITPPLEVLDGESANINVSVAVPTEHSENGWRLLDQKTILYLSVVLGSNFEMANLNYIHLSRMYFPYSGEYIRLTPPVFILEKISNLNASEEHSSEYYSKSVSNSNSILFPGIWHENLGGVTIKKLYELLKYVPDNSKFVLSIIWTLIASFNSFWAGNVEHCNIDMNSIFIYTGTNSQLRFNLEANLNDLIEDKPTEESINMVTGFILQTLSPPLIRFGNLGKSKVTTLNMSHSESSNTVSNECNDRYNLMMVIKDFLELSGSLLERLGGLGIDSICHEITNIDSSKLNCNSLAWVDPSKSYPKDLEKWPVTDVFIIPPSTNTNIVEEPRTVVPENIQSVSEFSDKSLSNVINTENSISINQTPVPVPVFTYEQNQEKSESEKSEKSLNLISEQEKIKENSSSTEKSDIFDPVSIEENELSSVQLENKQSPESKQILYDTEDLNEFILAKIQKGILMSLPFFPKVQESISEKKKFEINEMVSLLKGVINNIITAFTSWSASITGNHPEKIPNMKYRPMFILVPPTPNNRADSPKILEEHYYVNESVFLYAREEISRMILHEEQKGKDELVEVLICKANNHYLNLNTSQHRTEDYSEVLTQDNNSIGSENNGTDESQVESSSSKSGEVSDSSPLTSSSN
ncbi:hypothetical protein FG379_001944 [Cryptosporidium bovis]|uniref:uncharacterized protein n=1 Tax=Cryptosporidium bovis TaxID=310047 RepID=UPI00351A78F5|nr:hypothetical protein FG379_001944 [Cryptosporidium bovis]